MDPAVFPSAHLYGQGGRGHDPEGPFAFLGLFLSAAVGATIMTLLVESREGQRDTRARRIEVAVVITSLVLDTTAATVLIEPMKRLWTPSFALLAAPPGVVLTLAWWLALDRRDAPAGLDIQCLSLGPRFRATTPSYSPVRFTRPHGCAICAQRRDREVPVTCVLRVDHGGRKIHRHGHLLVSDPHEHQLSGAGHPASMLETTPAATAVDADAVPDAVAMMDPFHVVALAGDKLNTTRTQRSHQRQAGTPPRHRVGLPQPHLPPIALTPRRRRLPTPRPLFS